MGAVNTSLESSKLKVSTDILSLQKKKPDLQPLDLPMRDISYFKYKHKRKKIFKMLSLPHNVGTWQV